MNLAFTFNVEPCMLTEIFFPRPLETSFESDPVSVFSTEQRDRYNSGRHLHGVWILHPEQGKITDRPAYMYIYSIIILFLQLCIQLKKRGFFLFNIIQMDLPSCARLLKSKKLPKWFVPFLLRVLAMAVFAVTFLVLRVQLNKGSPNFSK